MNSEPQIPARSQGALRVLVLSCEEGEGHNAVARALEAELAAWPERVEVFIYDALKSLGRLIPLLSRDAYEIQLRWLAWSYGLECLIFARFPPGRALARMGLALFGARPLLRLIRRYDPDVVVSTHPAVTTIVGHLRRRGLLHVPALATISDLGVHALWAHPGIDLHLVMHESSLAPVERVAGPGSARVVRALVAPAFREPRTRQGARRGLGLPREGRIVVISGGGWGLGDLEGAVQAALQIEETTVVCVCGRNETALSRMQTLFGDEPRVRVLGFTERMSELLAGADALIQSTGGVTCLEALTRGCPIIAYGVPPGHARWNADALERLGFGEAARTPTQLTSALAHALARAESARPALPPAPAVAPLVLSARPRVESLHERRWRARVAAAAATLGTLVLAGWSFASPTPYPLVASALDLKTITVVHTSSREVGLIVEAPPPLVPKIAAELRTDRARASFAVLSPPSRGALATLRAQGDEPLPVFGTGSTLHWLRTSHRLGQEARVLGLRGRFYYLAPRSGFTLADYIAARAVGGIPILGAVSPPAGQPLGRIRFQAGDLVDITLGFPASSALATVDRLVARLGAGRLRAVSVTSLLRSAPTARERAKTPAPARTAASEAMSVTLVRRPEPQVSPARTGARPIGTSVFRAKTTGATCVAGRVCSADISLRVPTPAAAFIATNQKAMPSQARVERSSEKNFVASPSHAYATPAAAAMVRPGERLARASAYGRSATAPRAVSASTSAIPTACLGSRSGAAQPSPATPAAMATTPATSRRPTGSPSMRVPIASKTTRPAASAGCTSVSGATRRATL
jgi:processive 1,2-diacylglycerol beta-glucosyltransferase